MQNDVKELVNSYSVKTLKYDIDIDYMARVARLSHGKDPMQMTPISDVGKAFYTIKNCFTSGHMSVFEFGSITYLIECPIFVARQLMRYRCSSFLERSLRYNKPFDVNLPPGKVRDAYLASVEAYNDLIDCGWRKEDARSVLPLCTQTKFVWQLNLRELYHVFEERLSHHAQHNTRDVVNGMWTELFARNAFIAKLFADKLGYKEIAQ